MDAAWADRVLVIGVGNEFRGDDGVGVRVARGIASRSMPGVVVREASGEGVSLMEAWGGFSRVLVIDATSSGSPPGRVHRLDASREPIPSEFFRYSTHGFSLAEAIELARRLGTLPASLVVYGIEGKTFSPGLALSDEAGRAAEEVARQVQEELADRGAQSSRRSSGGRGA